MRVLLSIYTLIKEQKWPCCQRPPIGLQTVVGPRSGSMTATVIDGCNDVGSGLGFRVKGIWIRRHHRVWLPHHEGCLGSGKNGAGIHYHCLFRSKFSYVPKAIVSRSNILLECQFTLLKLCCQLPNFVICHQKHILAWKHLVWRRHVAHWCIQVNGHCGSCTCINNSTFYLHFSM